MRQLAPLFGISPAGAHRVIDRLGPHLALAPARRPGAGEVLIVDGALVPTHDRQVSASSKNYRYSTNLQVLIDANTRLVLTIDDPQPGNRNDCTAYAASGVDQATGTAIVIADGGYRGTGLLIPHLLVGGVVPPTRPAARLGQRSPPCPGTPTLVTR